MIRSAGCSEELVSTVGAWAEKACAIIQMHTYVRFTEAIYFTLLQFNVCQFYAYDFLLIKIKEVAKTRHISEDFNIFNNRP